MIFARVICIEKHFDRQKVAFQKIDFIDFKIRSCIFNISSVSRIPFENSQEWEEPETSKRPERLQRFKLRFFFNHMCNKISFFGYASFLVLLGEKDKERNLLGSNCWKLTERKNACCSGGVRSSIYLLSGKETVFFVAHVKFLGNSPRSVLAGRDGQSLS